MPNNDLSVVFYNGKLYQRNPDGTRGDEIPMSQTLDYINSIEHIYAGAQTDRTFTASVDGVLFYSMMGISQLKINGKFVIKSAYNATGAGGVLLTGSMPISVGDVVLFSAYGDGNQGSLLTEVPYK